MKSVIGIVANVDENYISSVGKNYVRAIELCGGVPLLLPYTESVETVREYERLCDGFLFTGGVDIHPRRYGQEPMECCGKINEVRDSFELFAFRELYAMGKPIMAICRGCQLVNVALGGTLYQDIETQYNKALLHRQTEGEFLPSHEVKITKDTPLYSLIKRGRMSANSFHHQAIRTLGDGLSVMAESDDGIIEAVYSTKSYLRAYQWHPERLIDCSEDNTVLFKDFIKNTKKRR